MWNKMNNSTLLTISSLFIVGFWPCLPAIYRNLFSCQAVSLSPNLLCRVFFKKVHRLNVSSTYFLVLTVQRNRLSCWINFFAKHPPEWGIWVWVQSSLLFFSTFTECDRRVCHQDIVRKNSRQLRLCDFLQISTQLESPGLSWRFPSVSVMKARKPPNANMEKDQNPMCSLFSPVYFKSIRINFIILMFGEPDSEYPQNI